MERETFIGRDNLRDKRAKGKTMRGTNHKRDK